MAQPQSSNDSKSSKGLKSKDYTGDTGFNLTTGEQGKKTVGMEVDSVDVDGKFVNITKGAHNSSTTGLACNEDMHVKDLVNVTGPSTMRMEDVTPWLSLFGNQPRAPSRPEKVTSQPATTNERTNLDDIISRIEERIADMYSEYDLPLKEFLRPNLSKLYAKTGDGINRLMYRLQEMRQLDDETVAEIEAMTTNMERCRRLYEVVAQVGAVRPLVLALEKSNNRHVIDLMESWL